MADGEEAGTHLTQLPRASGAALGPVGRPPSELFQGAECHRCLGRSQKGVSLPPPVIAHVQRSAPGQPSAMAWWLRGQRPGCHRREVVRGLGSGLTPPLGPDFTNGTF